MSPISTFAAIVRHMELLVLVLSALCSLSCIIPLTLALELSRTAPIVMFIMIVVVIQSTLKR